MCVLSVQSSLVEKGLSIFVEELQYVFHGRLEFATLSVCEHHRGHGVVEVEQCEGRALLQARCFDTRAHVHQD